MTIRRILHVTALTLAVLLALGPLIASQDTHALTDYERGYNFAYSKFYDLGYKAGKRASDNGAVNNAVYFSSKATQACVDAQAQVTNVSSDTKTGFCDAVTTGAYNGYVAGYTAV